MKEKVMENSVIANKTKDNLMTYHATKSKNKLS